MAGPQPRVTGGAFRGRRLHAAAVGTRPATALIREAIFNRPDVQAAIAGPVLDLYAGAGLLGVEALSRGAPRVDFVESNRAACAVIRANLAVVEAGVGARVLCLPVERCLPRLAPPYTCCFADPPYPLDAAHALTALVDAGILAPGGLLLWRHPARRSAPERLGPLAQVDQRRYGDGTLDTYREG